MYWNNILIYIRIDVKYIYFKCYVKTVWRFLVLCIFIYIHRWTACPQQQFGTLTFTQHQNIIFYAKTKLRLGQKNGNCDHFVPCRMFYLIRRFTWILSIFPLFRIIPLGWFWTNVQLIKINKYQLYMYIHTFEERWKLKKKWYIHIVCWVGFKRGFAK